ncbi:cytochrome P450 [Pseudoneurospora amorphoporcata]|uniref:Cytochrome P450 n=1 Tax=Pseudoneurospora amorphoporcata TaxID=241081 RepID=A0AAN6NQ19_9PEZI|nr:cytochrome P450 [Pseudoneurospora amorphoporcata]
MSTPIPRPPGVPVLGNLFDITPANTWWSLKTLAEKYGEIFQVKILGKTIVFVASAALAEELCDEQRFRKYVGGPIVEIRATVHASLFTAFHHEQSWGIHHRIMAPLLTPQVVSTYTDDINLCATELIQKWSSLGDNNVLEPLVDLNLLNLEATSLTLFSQKLNCIQAGGHPVIQAMEDAVSEAIMRPTRPGLVNWLLYSSKFKKATKTLRTWAADTVKYRQENPTDKQDMLWALMNAKDPETDKGLSESEVLDEIVSMPIGSATAPCAITATIYYLLQNPEVVTKARQELDRVIGAGPLKDEHLSQLKYIQGITRETLRLSCAAPGFNIEPIPRPNKADKSPILLQGVKYQVAHDQKLIIVLAGVNRDPAVFEDPLAFKPERMMGDEFDGLPKGVKKWFGNGKRECIGKEWAKNFLKIVTARLIHEVDFEMADEGYEFRQDGWFQIRPVGFRVRVKPRVRA